MAKVRFGYLVARLIWTAWFGWKASKTLDWGTGLGLFLGLVSLYLLWKQQLGTDREWTEGR